MKKYLVAVFVAVLGAFCANAQENKTIDVNKCKASSLSVEGSTLISNGYGQLVFPENDYTNFTENSTTGPNAAPKPAHA